jgi:hypothetical protein
VTAVSCRTGRRACVVVAQLCLHVCDTRRRDVRHPIRRCLPCCTCTRLLSVRSHSVGSAQPPRRGRQAHVVAARQPHVAGQAELPGQQQHQHLHTPRAAIDVVPWGWPRQGGAGAVACVIVQTAATRSGAAQCAPHTRRMRGCARCTRRTVEHPHPVAAGRPKQLQQPAQVVVLPVRVAHHRHALLLRGRADLQQAAGRAWPALA